MDYQQFDGLRKRLPGVFALAVALLLLTTGRLVAQGNASAPAPVPTAAPVKTAVPAAPPTGRTIGVTLTTSSQPSVGTLAPPPDGGGFNPFSIVKPILTVAVGLLGGFGIWVLMRKVLWRARIRSEIEAGKLLSVIRKEHASVLYWVWGLAFGFGFLFALATWFGIGSLS